MIATNRRRMVTVAVAFLALAATTTAVLTLRSGGGGSGAARTGPGGVPAGSVTADATDAAGPIGSPGPGGTAVPVIVPGRPGEPARVTPGDQVDPVPQRHNSMDIWFVRMMIPHHTQALQMAALAAERGANPEVRALADRVRASQVPEIQLLRGWLDDRHLDLDGPPAGHDHETMPGMQSAAAMHRLTAARGEAFDRLFVEMMTSHHQGAITMATDLLRVGIDPTVHQFATSVAVEQGVEIDRMRALLR